MQRRAAKLVKDLGHKSCEGVLGVFSLKRRRLGGDLITL